MDYFLWLSFGFIIIGFIILISMKKSMERKLAFIIENKDNPKSEQTDTKPIIWWIIAAVIWAIISILLIVLLFSVYT